MLAKGSRAGLICVVIDQIMTYEESDVTAQRARAHAHGNLGPILEACAATNRFCVPRVFNRPVRSTLSPVTSRRR